MIARDFGDLPAKRRPEHTLLEYSHPSNGPRRTPYRLVPFTVALCLSIWCSAAAAQVSVLEPEAQFESFPNLEFMSLVNDGAAVGYLPGSLDRAHHLLLRLNNLGGFFRRWSPKQAVPMAVYAVGREDWKRIELPGLYGLPLRASPSSVFVPALGDTEAVRMWRSALGVELLPMVPGQPVVGTPEEAAALALADVLLQLEASRGYAVAAGLTGREGWIQEVAAHVAALVAFRQTEPHRLAELHDMFSRLRQRMGGPGRHAAETFSQNLQRGAEQEVQAWLWFQGVFYEAAEQIVAKDGKRAVLRLLKMRESSRSLGRATLMKRYQFLSGWHQKWFVPHGADGSSEPSGFLPRDDGQVPEYQAEVR